jgi:hypothetical protein
MLAEVTGQAVVHAFGSTRQPVSCISMRLPHACKQAWHAAAAVVGFDPSAGTPSAGKDGHVTRKPTAFVSHGWMVGAKGTLLGTTAGAAPAGFAAHLCTTQRLFQSLVADSGHLAINARLLVVEGSTDQSRICHPRPNSRNLALSLAGDLWPCCCSGMRPAPAHTDAYDLPTGFV